MRRGGRAAEKAYPGSPMIKKYHLTLSRWVIFTKKNSIFSLKAVKQICQHGFRRGTGLLLTACLLALPPTRLNEAAAPAAVSDQPGWTACGRNTDIFFFHSATGPWAFSTGGVGDMLFLWTDPDQTPLADLRFGDFDGDGLTDVFSVSGTRWRYSPSGAQPWVNLEASNVPLGSLAFGDFDGDGKTDIFSIGSGNWRYSSAGLSTWKILRPADPGLTVADLAFGDFDGDGKTDAFTIINSKWAFSSGGTQDWQILQTQNLLPLSLADLRFGDFDGDGKTDVFTSYGGSWYLSSGGRTTLTHIQSSSVPLSDLHFGDFDGDGKMDVFSIGSGHWRYSSAGLSKWRLLSSAQHNHNQTIDQLRFGNFDVAGKRAPLLLETDLATFEVANDILSVDFNADGLPDLAASQFNLNAVSLWTNHTQPGAVSPTFDPSVNIVSSDGPRLLASGDFNVDGRPDLALVALSQSNALDIALNATSPGAASLSFSAPAVIPLGYRPSAIQAADFNADGLADLALANHTGNSVEVFLNKTIPGGATVQFGPVVSFLVDAGGEGLTTGDFNGDGSPDLASSSASSQSISLLINQTTSGSSTLSFAPQVSLSLFSSPADLIAADLNQDGRDDLASTDTLRDQISVQLNQTPPGGPLSFTGPVDFPIPNSGGAGAQSQHSLSALDLDQDGRLDLATASLSSSSMVVLFNATAAGFSTPAFEAPTEFFGGSDVLSLASGDFNQDGRPDVATAQLFANNLGLLSNQTQPASLVGQGGSGQSAPVGSPFPDPLVMSVADACGEGLVGAQIDFSTPPSGPGASLSDPMVISSALGFATVNATANQVAGSYHVTAKLPGTATQLSFDLTNTDAIANANNKLYLPLVSSPP